jgi:hypothetical protein
VRHPGADFIAQYMRGQCAPYWLGALRHSGQGGGGRSLDGSSSEEGP